MNIKELLKNKTILYSVIGGVAALLIIIILVVCISVSNGSSAEKTTDKIQKEPFTIIETDNAGKALEIQTLLARSGINAKRTLNGSKTTVFLAANKYTDAQRDRALLEIVKAGLVDQNVGLEIFDKSDFTSTKDDKRIKLARAVNGELSRLIRKLPKVENASVLVSIPDNSTLYTADKKPITVTVVLTIANQERLDDSVVKAIKSLLLGSVSGLTAENISITDTNGNVYNSLVKSIDDQVSKVQEMDQYMKNNVSAQLDRLVGPGNYVVTVSSFLSQKPVEQTQIIYDPDKKAALTEQTFNEGLGDTSQDSNKGSDAVSVYLPNGLANASSTSSQNKNYNRSATETNWGVTKTYRTETTKAGVIEKITIAVSMNANAMPANMSELELKTLIANAASPIVKPEDVSIGYVETIDPYLASDRAVNLPVVESSGNPWWLALVLIAVGLVVGFIFVHRKLKDSSLDQEEELKKLKEKTTEQEKQIVDVNLKAAELIEKQTILTQELLEQQKQLQLEKKSQPDLSLEEIIEEVSSDIEHADTEKTLKELKTWIEQS